MMSIYHSVDEALVGVLKTLGQSGEEASPRGLPTKEVLGITFRLSNPRTREIHNPARRWSRALAVGELCWHLAGSDDVNFISYYAEAWASFSDDGTHIRGSCYGKKIFDGTASKCSQWEAVKSILRADPSSRRAVLTLLEEAEDRRSAKDVACISTIQFLLRDGQLHCINNMRSNDVIWGMCYDVYLVTMLQEMLALELGLELGWYQHNAGSMHVYEHHYGIAQNIVDEGVPSYSGPMPPMNGLSHLPEVLAAERELRLGSKEGLSRAEHLPPYWRDLFSPLKALHRRRWSDTKDPVWE